MMDGFTYSMHMTRVSRCSLVVEGAPFDKSKFITFQNLLLSVGFLVLLTTTSLNVTYYSFTRALHCIQYINSYQRYTPSLHYERVVGPNVKMLIDAMNPMHGQSTGCPN